MPDMGKEYRNQWYQKNKEKHLNYCKERIICECGKEISRNSSSKHKTSEHHKKRMTKINEENKNLNDEVLKEIMNIKAILKELCNSGPNLIS